MSGALGKALKGAAKKVLALRAFFEDAKPAEVQQVNINFIQCVHMSLGDPPDCIGEPGHWFVDQGAQRMYGPKTAEGWPKSSVYMLQPAIAQFNLYDQSRMERAIAERFKFNRE